MSQRDEPGDTKPGDTKLAFPKPVKGSRAGEPKKKTGAGRSASQRKTIKARSNNRSTLEWLYRTFVRPAYLAGLAAGQGRRGLEPLCERCLKRGIKKARKSGKPKLVTEVHHMAGRRGTRLVDPLNLVGTCWNCHREIEAKREEAMAEGWSAPRTGEPREIPGLKWGEKSAPGEPERGLEGLAGASGGLDALAQAGDDLEDAVA